MKLICKKCKGTGLVWDKLEVVATVGISWVIGQLIPTDRGKEPCPRCKGKGYQKL